MALEIISVPARTEKPLSKLVIGLHGWGSNAQDLAGLAPHLDFPDVQLMFPNGPLVHPRVPGGFMWYDLGEGYRGLSESRDALRRWLTSLPSTTGVPLSHTVLAGFSQGAAMALDVGLHLPVAGLIALSGYLHPLVNLQETSLPPVLIVHGRQDQVVPLHSAQEAKKQLAAVGVSVDYHEFDMGHEIRPPVLALIRDFVQTVIP